jgi:hypothetical protein
VRAGELASGYVHRLVQNGDTAMRNTATAPTEWIVSADSGFEELNAFLFKARARAQDCEDFDEVRAAYGIDLSKGIVLVEPGIRIQRIRPGHGTRRATRPRGTHQRGSRRQPRSSGSSSGGGDPPDGESDESDDADGPLCVSEKTKRVCGCGCGESIDHLRPQAKYLNETHAKRAERTRVIVEQAGWDFLARDASSTRCSVPTLWAAEEQSERNVWRALGGTPLDRRIYRARLVSREEVDPEVLEVFLEESQGRVAA